jgi:hypothetical protein
MRVTFLHTAPVRMGSRDDHLGTALGPLLAAASWYPQGALIAAGMLAEVRLRG